MLSLNLLQCYGHCTISDIWSYDTIKGINRLYYIHGGEGGYRFNGVYHPFKTGYVYFFPSTVEYSLISSAQNGIDHTFVDFELLPPIHSSGIAEFRVPAENAILQKALETFLCGGDIFSSGTPSAPELSKLCFSAIEYIVMYAIKLTPGAAITSDNSVINALESMHSHIGGELTVEEMANANHLSTDCFIRRFKKSMGVTPYSYFKSLRIRTAQYMLDNGKPLSEVAASVGYSDASALSHALGKASNPTAAI